MSEQRFDAAQVVADVARTYLLNPPRGDDAVVRHLAPDQLAAVFDPVIPIELEAEVAAHTVDELRAAAELVVEYSVQTAHPRFLNQNFAGPDPVAVAGDWLGAALNTTGATYEAAPVFTLMEDALLRKLARIAGYPVADDMSAVAPGMFAPGGSSATLYALQLARHRLEPESVRKGATGERLVIFVSASGHYAAVKSAALLGIGMDNVVKVAVDDEGAMLADELAREIESVRSAGATPLAVIATAGTTVTSAFDPLPAIASICEAHNIWLHVDGCWGGSALFSPAEGDRLAGVERSDSFVWNLHKMMGLTQQCTVLLVRDPAQLAPCFATGADYLFQPDKLHGELDSGDRHFQCARRVDALKLWLTWQAYGDVGFAQRVDHAVAMADHVRNRIAASGNEFVTIVAGDFTNVVFVWVPPEFRPLDLAGLTSTQRAQLDALAPRTKARMQQAGSVLIGCQPIHGLNTFRFILMNSSVEPGDIDAVLDDIARSSAVEWSQNRQ